jgi:threonine dehydrogenase-like Zn-dependent dehydrogenase
VSLQAPKIIKFLDEILEVESIGPADVLCETLVSAISPGTELAAYNGLPALRPSTNYPRLQGYCNVSRVIAKGAQVTEFDLGERVLTFASHRSHFQIPEGQIICKVPETISDNDAVCTYLFHIGYDALLRSPIRYGSKVMVVGLGVLGLATVAVAACSGMEVYAISDQSNLRSVAQEFGAIQVFDRSDVPSIEEGLGPTLADTVISTTNSWEDWELCLKLVRPRGSIGVIGFPGRGAPIPKKNPFDSQYFYDKQVTIQCMGLAPKHDDSRNHLRFNEKTNMQFLLSQISSGNLNPGRLVSGVWPWNDIESAYKKINSREGSPITFILKWKG